MGIEVSTVMRPFAFRPVMGEVRSETSLDECGAAASGERSRGKGWRETSCGGVERTRSER